MVEVKMNGLAIKFEELKKMLVHKASASLGEASLKLFLTLLDGYQEELLQALNSSEKRIFDVKDENVMLQGLIGISDTEVRAKLASQSAEIRFLRQEVLDLRKNEKELESKNGALTLEVERLKNELSISFKARETDRQVVDRRMEELNASLKGYDDKIRTGQAELDVRKSELARKLSGISIEVEAQSQDVVKRIVVRLNNICREIEDALAVFKEEMEKIKSVPQVEKKKKFSFFPGPPKTVNPLAPILPSFNLFTEKVDDGANILKKYMETFTRPEVSPAKINWNKLIDDLKIKFGPLAAAKKIKITWPAGKMPVDFICDQGMLSKAFSAVIQNSIEALPAEGTIQINITFMKNSAQAVVTDNGKEIKPEHLEMLFEPLFTTKSSHCGLGLVNCRRLMRSLGGDAVYEPVKGGNTFKLTFLTVENKETKK